MKFVTVLTILSILWNIQLAAQHVKYQKRKFEWNKPVKKGEALAEQYKDEDAVILFEKVEWEINDLEQSTLFRKHIRIQFLTPKGIQKHSRITIPEPVDPPREYADIAMSKRAHIHRPKYFDLEILEFGARIIKPNGTVRNVSPMDSIEAERLEYNGNTRTAYAYYFSLPNIEEGDVVEIMYEYFLPYQFDWRRMFFHGILPKQHFEMSFTYPAREYVVWDYVNGASPTDSIKLPFKPYQIKLSWQYEHLAGCMNEVGAQIYQDLPHLNYYIHNKVFGRYEHDVIAEYQPYTWDYVAYDLIDFRKHNIHKTQKRISRKENALNQFYKQQTVSIPKQSLLKRLQHIHQTITEQFDFQADKDHFNNTDKRLAKLPSFFGERLLREINQSYLYSGLFHRFVENPTAQLETQAFVGTDAAKPERVPQSLKNKELYSTNRFSIYEGIFNRLKTDYYRVNIADKRVSLIDSHKCLPIIGENRLFSTQIGENIYYVYPKKARFGYALNELPFYLENTKTLHIDQMTESYLDKQNVLFFDTPQSQFKDNYRLIHVLGIVNLNEPQISFDAKVMLSGQYSTLTRGLYQYEEIDSTLNQRYSKKVSALNSASVGEYTYPLTYDKEYPFRAEVRLTYQGAELVSQTTDSTYLINMNNWFRHIIHEHFDADRRDLNYYPDFQGRDIYRYFLVFDQPVTLPDYKDLPLLIENSFGVYSFGIYAITDRIVMVESDFATIAEQVPTENAHEVAHLYSAIRQVEQSNLLIKVLPVLKKAE